MSLLSERAVVDEKEVQMRAELCELRSVERQTTFTRTLTKLASP